VLAQAESTTSELIAVAPDVVDARPGLVFQLRIAAPRFTRANSRAALFRQ